MVRRALGCLVVLALFTSGCGGGAEPERRVKGPRLTATVARDLDAQLRRKVEETGVPGGVAAVVFPDGRMWSGAAGVALLAPNRD